jgi:hypothetical protein
MAGRGSLAGLLPFADANAVVLDMANEVLPVCFFFLFLSILLFLEGNIVQLLNSVQVLFTSGG